MRGRRFEVSTSGLDSALQGVWSDPYGGAYNVGLRVPQVPPQVRTYKNRYLFTLAGARFGYGRRVRLVGFRQLLTVAALNPTTDNPNPVCILEKTVPTSEPFWHFTDASVSWGIRVVPMGLEPENRPGNGDGVAWRYSVSPALLFESGVSPGGIVTQNYKPPYAGRAPGVGLDSWGNFHDVRTPWASDHAQHSMDYLFEGPCDVLFVASVQQTVFASRTKIVFPTPLPYGTECLPSMDAFVGNFDNAGIATTYWRIAGSLIFEEEPIVPHPRDVVVGETWPWCPPAGVPGGTRGGIVEGGGELAPPREGGGSRGSGGRRR